MCQAFGWQYKESWSKSCCPVLPFGKMLKSLGMVKRFTNICFFFQPWRITHWWGREEERKTSLHLHKVLGLSSTLLPSIPWIIPAHSPTHTFHLPWCSINTFYFSNLPVFHHCALCMSLPSTPSFYCTPNQILQRFCSFSLLSAKWNL